MAQSRYVIGGRREPEGEEQVAHAETHRRYRYRSADRESELLSTLLLSWIDFFLNFMQFWVGSAVLYRFS